MDKQIGLRQKAFITEITLGSTKNDYPMLSFTVSYGDTVKRVFWPMWENMKDTAKAKLKENCLQLLEAYKVPNANEIIAAKYSPAEAFFQAVIDALPENYEITPVDIFTVYEYEIQKPYTNSKGERVVPDRTWATIATGASGVSKNGPWRLLWISPAQKGVFTVQDEGDVIYFNEKGQEHPIQRWSSWRTSNEAVPQGNIGKRQAEQPSTPPEPAENSGKMPVAGGGKLPF
jgi:hypothetical protein